jgi:hypothetical protein
MVKIYSIYGGLQINGAPFNNLLPQITGRTSPAINKTKQHLQLATLACDKHALPIIIRHTMVGFVYGIPAR